MHTKTHIFIVLLMVFSFTACGQDQQERAELAPLISAAQLAELLEAKTPGVRVLAPGRDSANYDQGHLPTAVFVHWVDDMTDPEEAALYKNPTATDFAALMSRLGLKNDDRIIIYDRLASRLSTRLYWTLKYYGHEQVQILDGGFNAWKSDFDVSTDAVEVVASEYEVTAMNGQLLAEMNFVEEHLDDPNARLIDGRPTEQYSGESVGLIFHTKEEHPRKGHIPGAINVVWKDNFNKDGTFKTAEELRALYKGAGVLSDQCVITYCNEGLHAAPPWFVLTELLDFEDVRLYDSSMAEWAKSANPLKEVAN